MTKEERLAVSARFQEAITYVKDNIGPQSESQIAKEMKIPITAFNMAKNNYRPPSWDILLKFCDHYPINFWWLRGGEGDMIGNGDRQIALLQKIAQLEAKIAELENR
ncbi:MAG: hypothetical protein IKR38_03045 [Bacteroidales bacterium]|nr:hypothetical protein [Bacteroidales bacterium]